MLYKVKVGKGVLYGWVLGELSSSWVGFVLDFGLFCFGVSVVLGVVVF